MRDMAKDFSSAVRYGALVLLGVSGKKKKPYMATGNVMMPSIMKSQRHPERPLSPFMLE